MTRRLSSGIEDRCYLGCNDCETGAPSPDYPPPPFLTLYREHFSTVDVPSSLKKEGVVPSETLGTIYQATRRYISEHSRPRENPNSHNFRTVSQSINKMDLGAVGLEEGWNVKLAQDRVQWRALVSAVSNLRIPLSASYFI
jgi:hypothetical protein